jgi:mono/diheme cytochrome c family protein
VESGEWRVESERWTVDSGQWIEDSGRWVVTTLPPLPTVHCPLSTNSALAICLLFLLGCSWSPPPEFKLNTEGRDPHSIRQSQRDSIVRTLEKLFGTPDKAAVPEGAGFDENLLAVAAGPVGSDENDNPRGLYRKHCVACHGISGDGSGPNAAALLPYPRDYRPGIFKFTSTAGGGKPVREDLLRILRTGIPGTAMPSFGKLPAEQLESLAEYVKYLSLRGETELYLVQLVVDEDETLDPAKMDELVEEAVLPIANAWEAADALRVKPPPPPSTDTTELLAASLAAGRAIFRSTGAQCFKCHGPEGRGDGEQSALYDDWNKKKKGATPEQTRQMAALFSLPLVGIKPRNFTEGIFRGGDRPVDQYYRIAVGIKGTPMPPAGPSPGSKGILAPEDIWHVVNFVRSLGKLPDAKK